MVDDEVVVLRTGEEMSKGLVATAMYVLDAMRKENTIAFYEAVMIARDSSHAPYGNTGETLRKAEFFDEDGRMHAALRSIILAATEGEGLDLKLVSPFSATD